jgi:hypothetical protein
LQRLLRQAVVEPVGSEGMRLLSNDGQDEATDGGVIAGLVATGTIAIGIVAVDRTTTWNSKLGYLESTLRSRPV